MEFDIKFNSIQQLNRIQIEFKANGMQIGGTNI